MTKRRGKKARTLFMMPGYGRIVHPGFGKPYGNRPHITEHGTPVWMWRKRQAVRFYDRYGVQHGPEQTNVAPAVYYAYAMGWR